MEKTWQRKGQFTGIPFYIFISLLLGVLAVVGTRAVIQSGTSQGAILYILLFAAHIGLYWLNLKRFQHRSWSVVYYILQAILIVALVNFPYGGAGIRISILGSTTLCMIGESLGLWGNTRRSLFLGLSYAGLAVVLLYGAVGRDGFGAALSGLLANGVFIVLFMIVLNSELAERAKAMELAETLESANAKLAAYSARIEALTLQYERQRMARELHDTLAQGVAGLVLQLEAVKNHLQTGHHERALSIVEQSLKRARGTLSESRAAIDDLRSPPEDLANSVRERVERFKQTTGIPCELVLSLNENGLSPDIADQALSILSEALANITRHAQATSVTVKFAVEKEDLVMEIHDNGKGFDVERQTSTGHYGLLGMRERARLTGGILTVESKPDRGTHIHFRVARSQDGGVR
jgi:two-component system, NarL family, sensor histidine kinase YdfH